MKRFFFIVNIFYSLEYEHRKGLYQAYFLVKTQAGALIRTCLYLAAKITELSKSLNTN
jgi:hypothetical protein